MRRVVSEAIASETPGVTDQVIAGKPDSRAMYAPSWIDVVNGWFDRLPGPIWAGYTVAILIAAGVSASSSLAGPVTTTSLLSVAYYSALPFGILGLIHGLDRVASQALAAIRPLLQMDDDEIAVAHHRLTVIPARPAILLTAFGYVSAAVGYVLDPVGSGIVGMTPLTLGFRGAWEGFVSTLFVILLYHTVRQLRQIGGIHERLGAIDLFAQAPLYALSRLTSRTAVGLVLLMIPSLFLIPSGADISYVLITAVWYGGALAMAVAAFLVPLRGVHDRLVAEKRRLQSETGHRLTTALAALHTAADAGDGGSVEARGKTLAALVAARDVVNRAQTWPWSGGALTGFVSAIALPIVLFLIQRFLSQVV
jgi:hypothetical protein